MAHPVRLLFSALLIIGACTESAVKLPQPEVDQPWVWADTADIVTHKGLTTLEGEILSAFVLETYPNSSDTLKVTSFVRGYKHGTSTAYFPNNTLREIREYKKGRKVGEYIGYFPNGDVHFSFHFENDNYHGTAKEWTQEGILIKEMNYDKGYESGPQKVWYDNGKIKSNYIVKDGRRYGLLGTKNCINVKDSIAL